MNPVSTVERAGDLEAEIIGILVAAGIDDATATSDLLKVPAALANGPVVAVQPPKLKFIATMAGYGIEATWELFIIAGPYADRLAAWTTMDPIIQALATPLSIDDAEPATFSHPGMPEYPAYVLSFTEQL
jgi:hypothetical protein